MVARTVSWRAWIQICGDVLRGSFQRKLMTVNCWKLGREQLIREYRGTAIQKGSYAYYMFAPRRVQYVILSGERSLRWR